MTTTLFPVPAAVRDAGLLFARVLLGVVLVAQGWQKLSGGVPAVAQGFTKMGVPLPGAAAWFATLVELVGGVLLILGALTPVVALLVAMDMAGAWLFAHLGHGPFVAKGGWELVVLIGSLAVVIALVGPGRASVDALIASRRAVPDTRPSSTKTHAAV